MSDGYGEVRSYQRIFSPVRRIYQVEGYRLPIPGGVPLGWLGYAAASLIVILALSAQVVAVVVVSGVLGGAWGLVVAGRRGAVIAAAVFAVAAPALGLVLGVMDWPLRLVVAPGALAT